MASGRQLIGRDLKGLERGDMVEFERGAYSHWGVYVGNRHVIHLTGSDEDIFGPFSISGQSYKEAKVVKEDIWEVADRKPFYKNNFLDGQHRARSPVEIVAFAESKLGKADYNVLGKNCEHFATLCRNNVEQSGQVKKVGHIINKVAGAGLVILLAVGVIFLLRK